jgi:hypothetical protein
VLGHEGENERGILMELPWLWMILMTIVELAVGYNKIRENESPDFAFGVICGMWMLTCVGYAQTWFT